MAHKVRANKEGTGYEVYNAVKPTEVVATKDELSEALTLARNLNEGKQAD